MTLLQIQEGDGVTDEGSQFAERGGEGKGRQLGCRQG